MIWVAICFLSVVAMGVLAFIATERSYQRQLAQKKAEKIREAEEALKKALVENKQDVLLHATLYDNLKRLRGK